MYQLKTVFNQLKKTNDGDSISIIQNDVKIFEITKMYNQTGFPNDENSVGYAINIYQETINKVFREYLVNFEFLVRIMENYGFVLIPRVDAIRFGLPNASGLFNELFTSMEQEIWQKRNQSDYGDAIYMSSSEKRISFMNRYFIFQKMRDINTNQISIKPKEIEVSKIFVRKLKVPKFKIHKFIPVAEPIVEPVSEPIAELDAEPIAELDAEPIAELDAEPIVELDAEPIAELDAEPLVEPPVNKKVKTIRIKKPVVEKLADEKPMKIRIKKPVVEKPVDEKPMKIRIKKPTV